jgi:3'-phosphoadenosine 5'-phosphosulfate (PAPS) 3'-phosphatase
MSITLSELKKLEELAVDTVNEASQLIMSNYKPFSSFHSKGNANFAGDVLTETDIAVQKLIVDRLEKHGGGFPVVAEEEGMDVNESRFDSEAFWCVDPMDGTRSFVEYNNGFASSISLISKDGTSLLGAVALPAFQEIFSAIKDGGIRRNGEDFKVSDPGDLFSLYVIRGDLMVPENVERFQKLKEWLKANNYCKKTTVVPFAGAVCSACLSLMNPPSAYISFPRSGSGVHIWDMAAIDCLMREAGGWSSDFYGNPLDLNKKQGTGIHDKGFVMGNSTTLCGQLIEKLGKTEI